MTGWDWVIVGVALGAIYLAVMFLLYIHRHGHKNGTL